MRNKNLHNVRRNIKTYLLLFTILLMTACGGGGDGGSSDPGTGGELIGTGMHGTAATGEAIANASIRIKSQSGVVVTTTTNAQGKFESPEVKEANASTQRGPYLLQIDQGDGEYLYSIAHVMNAETIDADSAEITINIHPFTDLIVRNWFAQNNVDIDAAIIGTDAIDELPTAAQIASISDEFLNIVTRVLGENGASTEADLLAEEFDADQTGFDQFLDNSQVIINNNTINVVINQPNIVNGIQNNIILDVSLDYDFTTVNDSPPSLPTEVRVLPTDKDNEAIIVWTPAADDKGIPYYLIYRDGIEIGSTPYPVFFDATPEQGVVYSYTVEAIDSAGQGSGQTSGVEIELDVPDTTPPPPASNVQLSELNGVVSLVWNVAEIDDVAGFRIYRDAQGAVSEMQEEDFIAAVTSNTFDDFNVMTGAEYCYLIVAYDAAGNDAPATAEACITVGGIAPNPSEVAFSAATYSVIESAGSIVITVSRTGDVSQAISIEYSALAGTATADADFTETTGALNWAANDNSDKAFTVQLAENAELEPDETVLLELTNPSQFTSLGNISSATLTITDAPQVSCVDFSTLYIDNDTTLSEPCYNIINRLEVRNNATLTIAPGVRMQFAEGIGFYIANNGILSAVGTANDPIVFTGQLPGAGFWNGIRIWSILPSQIRHAVVEYGGADGANVELSSSGRLALTDTVIRHSSAYGFSMGNLGSSLVEFSGNTITLNEDAPVNIPANFVGALDSANNLTGNVTQVGGDRDYINVTNSTITNDQTWHSFDVDYRMPSNSQRIESVLTLSPGVKLVFPANAQLNVATAGTLKAIGSQAEPIIFTGEQESPGFWWGIQFTSSDNDNVMDHAVVEYGGGGGNTDANVGVLGNGRLSISNTTLRHSVSYGFEFDDNIDLTMSNITSTSNESPGAVGFNEMGLLDSLSAFEGNTDDRIWVPASNSFPGSVSQTVKAIGVPYYIVKTTTHSVSAALTIEPGVELQFSANGGLNVSSTGTLIADGTPEAPIVFTGAQKTKGYWNGIQFTFSQNANLIDNAILEYGGSPSGNTQGLLGFFGNVPANASNGIVTNTVLRHSQTNGIWRDDDTTGDFSVGNTFEDIDGQDIFINN